jgi:hypothetical protein
MFDGIRPQQMVANPGFVSPKKLAENGPIAVKNIGRLQVDRRLLTRYVSRAQKTDDKRHGPKSICCQASFAARVIS